MKTIGVIGTGTMGGGIATAASQVRCDVLFQNRRQESVDRGIRRIQKELEKQVSRDKLTQAQCEGILERIRGVVPLEEFKACDLVIESAPEDLEIKQDLFEKLSGVVSDRCIIATNTSSLSITKLASFVSGPERFIGMHFFNPVSMLKLVEVVRGMETSIHRLLPTILKEHFAANLRGGQGDTTTHRSGSDDSNCLHHDTHSTATATASPPPMHNVAIPRRRPRSLRA